MLLAFGILKLRHFKAIEITSETGTLPVVTSLVTLVYGPTF